MLAEAPLADSERIDGPFAGAHTTRSGSGMTKVPGVIRRSITASESVRAVEIPGREMRKEDERCEQLKL